MSLVKRQTKRRSLGAFSDQKKLSKPRGAIVPKPKGGPHELEPPSRIKIEYENGQADGFRGVEMKPENRFLGTPLLLLAYRNGYNAGQFQRACMRVAK